jgi:hypothetical protein
MNFRMDASRTTMNEFSFDAETTRATPESVAEEFHVHLPNLANEFTSAEQTSNNPLQYFPYLDLSARCPHLHYISSISPCFLFLVTNYV